MGENILIEEKPTELVLVALVSKKDRMKGMLSMLPTKQLKERFCSKLRIVK